MKVHIRALCILISVSRASIAIAADEDCHRSVVLKCPDSANARIVDAGSSDRQKFELRQRLDDSQQQLKDEIDADRNELPTTTVYGTKDATKTGPQQFREEIDKSKPRDCRSAYVYGPKMTFSVSQFFDDAVHGSFCSW